MNNFKDNALQYHDMGLSVIPDKFGTKIPAIKEWSRFCDELSSLDDIHQWSTTFSTSNIALCLGEASGIIALDVDSVDQKILDLIVPLLPSSPLEKYGAKGFTRFFRYSGEHTQTIKFNGEVVLELLSGGKKTTLPPSLHPSGVNYKWVSEKTLLDVNAKDLPLFPPFLLANIESKLKLHFKDFDSKDKTHMTSGRNNDLSKLCGVLIGNRTPINQAITELIKFDTEKNVPPLFSDPEEMMSTDKVTNALAFYSNHLQSVNNKHYKRSEEYEVPVMYIEENIEPGKSLKKAKPLKRSLDAIPARGALKIIQSWILENSWIKQPAFAFSASLALFGTLGSRKYIFQGSTSNVYLLNIAPSGSGKDFPQQAIKEILSIVHADKLLGSGDYGSDAAIMDGLANNPVRLDVLDEAGGILKSITSSKAEYASKMADILAELYTTSTSKYLGRSLSEGTKGSCYRPHVNILASTTPTGFSEGVSMKAIEKGLLGRFLVFNGDASTPATRIFKKSRIDVFTLESLKYLVNHVPTEENLHVGDLPQLCDELTIDKKANDLLSTYFAEFDALRRNSKPTNNMLPIISRLYQQMIKIVMISAISRHEMKTPNIDVGDVEFGYNTIMYYYEDMCEIVKNYIHDNKESAESARILKIIADSNEISKPDLIKLTKFTNKKARDAIILDLIDSGSLNVFLRENETWFVANL